MRHTQHVCGEETCFVCNGGLAWCTVCGGAEASMPTECPGVKMTQYQQDLVQAGVLDYVERGWRSGGELDFYRQKQAIARRKSDGD